MRNWIDFEELQERRLPTENLKCCPLCCALNAIQNGECFVCGWHGRFDHDPELIEERLRDLIARCPELAEAMTETAPPPVRAWWHRWIGVLAGVFHRGIDLRV